MILGLIEDGGFAGPAFIGESSELFDLRLSDKILLLLLDARGVFSDMSQPLVPLRCHLNITQMSFGIESNNASEPRCIQHILELPEGISSEILT